MEISHEMKAKTTSELGESQKETFGDYHCLQEREAKGTESIRRSGMPSEAVLNRLKTGRLIVDRHGDMLHGLVKKEDQTAARLFTFNSKMTRLVGHPELVIDQPGPGFLDAEAQPRRTWKPRHAALRGCEEEINEWFPFGAKDYAI